MIDAHGYLRCEGVNAKGFPCRRIFGRYFEGRLDVICDKCGHHNQFRYVTTTLSSNLPVQQWQFGVTKDVRCGDGCCHAVSAS